MYFSPPTSRVELGTISTLCIITVQHYRLNCSQYEELQRIAASLTVTLNHTGSHTLRIFPFIAMLLYIW